MAVSNGSRGVDASSQRSRRKGVEYQRSGRCHRKTQKERKAASKERRKVETLEGPDEVTIRQPGQKSQKEREGEGATLKRDSRCLWPADERRGRGRGQACWATLGHAAPSTTGTGMGERHGVGAPPGTRPPSPWWRPYFPPPTPLARTERGWTMCCSKQDGRRWLAGWGAYSRDNLSTGGLPLALGRECVGECNTPLPLGAARRPARGTAAALAW